MRDEHREAFQLLMGSHYASLALALVVDIALLLVAVLVIRKHRPDVWGWFLAWSVAGLLVAIARPLSDLALMMQPGIIRDISSMYRYRALLNLAWAGVHAGVACVLIVGLVKLARGPARSEEVA